MNLQLTQEGRRLWIGGNTHNIKEDLELAGAHYDPQKKAWWLGASKKRLVNNLMKKECAKPKMAVGMAAYKGRKYFVVWHGRTKFGYSFLLTTMDEKIQFWANEGCRLIATYREPRSLADMRAYNKGKKN